MLQFLSVLLFAALLQPINGAALHNGTHEGVYNGTGVDGCGYKSYTNATWMDSGINTWLGNLQTDFNHRMKDTESFIKDYIVPKYANKTGRAGASCRTDDPCNVSTCHWSNTVNAHLYPQFVPTCDAITTSNRTEGEYVLNLAASMFELESFLKEILKAVDVANIALAQGMSTEVERFTYADEFDKWEDQLEIKQRSWLKTGMYALNLANSYLALEIAMVPPFEGKDQVMWPFQLVNAEINFAFSAYLLYNTVMDELKKGVGGGPDPNT